MLRGNSTQTKIEDVLCAISKLLTFFFFFFFFFFLKKNVSVFSQLSEELKNDIQILAVIDQNVLNQY